MSKKRFFVQGHFPDQPVMPNTNCGGFWSGGGGGAPDKSTYENKLVFLMGVEKARLNPVILIVALLNIEN